MRAKSVGMLACAAASRVGRRAATDPPQTRRARTPLPGAATDASSARRPSACRTSGRSAASIACTRAPAWPLPVRWSPPRPRICGPTSNADEGLPSSRLDALSLPRFPLFPSSLLSLSLFLFLLLLLLLSLSLSPDPSSPALLQCKTLSSLPLSSRARSLVLSLSRLCSSRQRCGNRRARNRQIGGIKGVATMSTGVPLHLHHACQRDGAARARRHPGSRRQRQRPA